MQLHIYNADILCKLHRKPSFHSKQPQTSRSVSKWTLSLLTPIVLQEAGCTSARLKQWDGKHRQSAVVWQWGSLCVYPACWAPAVGHWLPSTPWSILLDTRCLSHACCTVGCPKHDGTMALNLNEEQPRWETNAAFRRGIGQTTHFMHFSKK